MPDAADIKAVLLALKDDDSGARAGKDGDPWHRVAVLLVALGQDVAADVLGRFEDRDVEQITQAIARLDTVSRQQQSQALSEFAELLDKGEFTLEGGDRYARELLEQALGEQRADEVWKRVGGTSSGDGFSLLDGADPAQVASFMRQQHPQTTALVMTQLRPEQAAAILERLPETMQADIARRIATLEQVSPDVLKQIEETIVEQLQDALGGQRAVEGVKAAADILNRVGASLEKSVLYRLESQDPEIAEEIRSRMFVFDDIARLDDRDLRLVIQNADARDLVISLKAAGKGVLERILSTMTERRQQIFLDDLGALPPLRLSDVEETQQRLVQHMRQMMDQGLIELRRGGDDEEYV